MTDQSRNTQESFPSQYDPKQFEERIYTTWEKSGAFHSQPNSKRKPYTIMIPPPNVTGVLHIGHALNNTLQDVLIRWRHMQGYETLWLPGTDHAGIATQNVVEKQIAKQERRNRYQIGREELIRRIWAWKEESGGIILKQLRKLGASCDWERARFTLDETLSKAVRHAFTRLFQDGLIYRGKYLVNWCPRCHTTLSDDEVEHAEVKGKLYELHYPFDTSFTPLKEFNGELIPDETHPKFLTVATTRPETMLGDTAVAVHPDDERYRDYVGQFLELPLTGRKIQIIKDSAIEHEFGTGCLKVTPAHDPVDYQIGQRHKLPMIDIFTESATLNENAPAAYRGLDRLKAREKIVEDLRAAGLMGEIKDHTQQVGHCYRCHTMIEPRLSAQWFVKMKPLSELAVKATAERRVTFFPERWTKVYLKWFEDARDWPISRQIWWGHQVPVWYDLDANKEHISIIEVGEHEPYDQIKDGKRIRYLIGEKATPIVSLEDPSALPQYQGKSLLRDPDVLDTWFSSALWPFSALGWPEQTSELKYYYPTSALVTARGIIYFWVARMVMLGEKMLEREPFANVYIHGTVLDEQGRIMSKSLGNGIDPLEVIDKYGADALRFTITTMCTEGQDLKISMKRFEMGRNFANKVWNAARFVLTNIQIGASFDYAQLKPHLQSEDLWILSRLNSAVQAVTEALESFAFSKAIGALYDFFWNEFCSWYIELSKPRLLLASDAPERVAAQAVLLYTLDRSLRLLHPFCPFVSEALWAEMQCRAAASARNLYRSDRNDSMTPNQERGGCDLLLHARCPQVESEWIDLEREAQFASLFEAITAIRAARQELIDNSSKERKKDVSAALAKPFRVVIHTADSALAARLKAQSHILTRMANTQPPEIGADVIAPAPVAATAIKGGVIYVALTADLLEAEKLRLKKEIVKYEQYIPKAQSKLQNEDFIKHAPSELVAEERQRLKEAQNKCDNLKTALAALYTMRG